MNINRKQIIETFIKIVSHISDKKYQQRVWIAGEGQEVDDFDETVCHFFQEGDGILENYKEFGLTENQYELLKRFRDSFEAFADNHDLPEEFINTFEWDKITQMAKEVLQAFHYPKTRN